MALLDLSPVPVASRVSVDDDVFESSVLQNPFSVDSWLRYIEFKRGSGSGSLSDRFLLYERALSSVPRSYKLWTSYLVERMRAVGTRLDASKVEQLAQTVYAFERALSSLASMPVLWLLYARFLQQQALITRTRRVFDRALQSLPITQHHLIWSRYIEFVCNRWVSVPPFASSSLSPSSVPVETCIRVFRRYIQISPKARSAFAAELSRQSHYRELIALFCELVNDASYVPEEGKSREDLWAELCSLLCSQAEHVPAHVDAEAVLRSGLARYTNEAGVLWCGLADFHVRLGRFERARDVYEEALASVNTVAEFSKVFDAYAVFEEGMLSSKMEEQEDEAVQNTEEDDDVDFDVDGDDVEMRLVRLESLMGRRPLLVNTVLLKQNPHNVKHWLKRARLFNDDPERELDVYRAAIDAIDPSKASGKLHQVWAGFARLYEDNDDLDSAKLVFQRSFDVRFRSSEERAECYCLCAEMELRHSRAQDALATLRRATALAPLTAPEPQRRPSSRSNEAWRSTRLWHFLADLEENLGTLESASAVYEQMLSLSLATPQTVLQYASMLEEKRFFEASFAAFEKGLARFKYPHAFLLWKTYLQKFVARYQGKKLERARELFEQSLKGVPSEFAKILFLLYASFEERFGLSRNAMMVYGRALKAVSDEEKLEVFNIYVCRATELFGVTKTREIYERAIYDLPDGLVGKVCAEYAALEKSLGEVDRCRAIYSYGSQFCNPASETAYWSAFHEFEVQHGNEDTYREMLRLRRSVAAEMAQTHFAATTANLAAGAKLAQNDLEALEMAAAEPPSEIVMEGTAELQEVPAANPEEIDLMDEEEDEEKENVTIEQKSVPDAVFGAVLERPQAPAEKGQVGALQRFRNRAGQE